MKDVHIQDTFSYTFFPGNWHLIHTFLSYSRKHIRRQINESDSLKIIPNVSYLTVNRERLLMIYLEISLTPDYH